jgi:hypothetical protein
MGWVWVPDKPEFPPLFPPEMRPFTLPELRVLCVDGFPLSDSRDLLMSCLEHAFAVLEQSGIVGELWVDGSFLTHKIDPDDVDLVLAMDAAFVDSASPEQREVMTWFADHPPKLRRWLRCHNFSLPIFRRGIRSIGRVFTGTPIGSGNGDSTEMLMS